MLLSFLEREAFASGQERFRVLLRRRSTSLSPFSPTVPTTDLIVGIDAGGSKTILLAERTDPSDRIEHQGPAANPQRVGLETAAGTLETLVRSLLPSDLPLETLAVCAGVAGAGRTDDQKVLAEHLRTALTDVASTLAIEVVHDALIALDAAFDSGSGLVVIAGTGSVAIARTTGGTVRRVGGWGYLLGDPGSGYAVGRAGLRAVAEAFDGNTDTALRAGLQEQYAIGDREDLLQRVYQTDFAFHDVAPLVIEAAEGGDAVASGILNRQAAELVRQGQWLLDGPGDVAPRIALFGGMLRNDHYAQVLRRTLREAVPEWSIELLRHEPVVGALRRAHRLVP